MKSLISQWRAADQNLAVRRSKNKNREDKVQHETVVKSEINNLVQTTQTLSFSLFLGFWNNSFTKYKAEEAVENDTQAPPASVQVITENPQHFISTSGIKETELWTI